MCFKMWFKSTPTEMESKYLYKVISLVHIFCQVRDFCQPKSIDIALFLQCRHVSGATSNEYPQHYFHGEA